ncbi:MAG: YdeI/OmpD-associated family protein [Bacteroidota bacterium]
MIEEFQDIQHIGQLGKHRGSYFYVTLDASIVDKFKNKRKTRFICTLENKLNFQCGLNHLGDGNFFIILSGKRLKELGKKKGDEITFHLKEDPNPLGVEMPEVLEVLLEQDKELSNKFESLSMGKKRHVIHSIVKIKNIDKQVEKAIKMIELHTKK